MTAHPTPHPPQAPATHTPQRVAVIGGGWAGMAAAVQLTRSGQQVHVFEAAHHWGGRARGLAITGPEGQTWQVDNGQHILIGAYSQCLDLMRTVRVRPENAFVRTPLNLRNVYGHGLCLPDLPPPYDALLGILQTRGWIGRDKVHLLVRAVRWRLSGFRCAPQATVADVCRGLPPRVLRDFIEPLCVSALNLPAAQASGTVFLRVLQDALFSGAGGSNLLLPRQDMGQLFPDAAATWLAAQGATLHLGQRVHSLAPEAGGGWRVNDQTFDTVLLATASAPAARLVQAAAAHMPEAHAEAAQTWTQQAQALPHTAIATVYAYTPAADGPVLPAPMVALHSSADAPAQFAFDRFQLGGPAGLLALVVSDSQASREELEAQVIAQARAQLQLPDLQALQTVVDKRATFACTPGVVRPSAHIAPGLWACGDYVQGPYPATLEGAVRSGIDAAVQATAAA